MLAEPYETPAQTSRRWRRWLWQTALTGTPARDLSFEHAVFAESGLAGLIGDAAYGDLVEALCGDPSVMGDEGIARKILDAHFPSACLCHRHARLDHDAVSFNGPNVYRALYYSDDSVTKDFRVLFRRTPDLTLYACDECGETWLGALDQSMWEQHLLLIEPEDIARIEAHGVWPDGLDRFEDAWVAEFDVLGRNSPGLRAWQADNNTPEAFARFGKLEIIRPSTCNRLE